MRNRMVPSSKKVPKGILKGMVAPAIPAHELYPHSPKADPAARVRMFDFVRHQTLDMSSAATSSRTAWLGKSRLYDRNVGRVYLDTVEYCGLVPPDRLDRQFVLPETSILSAGFPDASPIVFDMDGVTFKVVAEDMRLASDVDIFLRRRVYPGALMRDPDLELIADIIVYHCDGRAPQRMWLNIPVLNAILNDYAKHDPAAFVDSDFNWSGVLAYLMDHYTLPNKLWLLAADRVPLDCYGYQAILAEFYRQDAQSASLASALAVAPATYIGAVSSEMCASVSAGAKRKRAEYSSDEGASEDSSIECPATAHIESPMESSPLGCSEASSVGADSLCFFREPPKITRDRFAVAALLDGSDLAYGFGAFWA